MVQFGSGGKEQVALACSRRTVQEDRAVPQKQGAAQKLYHIAVSAARKEILKGKGRPVRGTARFSSGYAAQGNVAARPHIADIERAEEFPQAGFEAAFAL